MRTRSAALFALLALGSLQTAAWAQHNGSAGNMPCSASTKPTEAMDAQSLAQQAQRCRDQKQWNAALAFYKQGQHRFPKNLHFPAREAMTLADAGHTEEALNKAISLTQRFASAPDAYLALSYVYASLNRPFDALNAADRALSLAPTTPYVIVEHIQALNRAGLVYAAYFAARRHTTLIDPAISRRLHADYLAEKVRLAALPTRQRADGLRMADEVIADYDALISQWEREGGQAAQDAKRLRVDRLQALHARGRMRDVIVAYEELQHNGQTVPDYVLNQVASAYLSVQQPEQAQAIYKRAQSNPALTRREQVDVQLGLYYAQSESGLVDEARNTIDTARDAQALWVNVPGSPTRLPNDLRMHTEAPWALAYLYGNDTSAAQEKLEDMTAMAPQNTTLRIALASVYRARGWPRRAEEELKRAEALEPRSIQLIAEQGQTELDLHAWENAHTLLDYLEQNAPEDNATRRLRKAWDREQKAIVYITAGMDRSQDNPVTGDHNLRLETVAYSAPLKGNWRLFAGAGQAQGDFPEGSVTQRWGRVGAQYRDRDVLAELETSAQHSDYGTQAGLRASVEYALNDQWALGGELAWRSLATPLRATANDIRSNDASAFVRWRRSEQGEWTLAVSGARFSDGNKRSSVFIRGKERLYTTPTVTLDAELDASASKNTKQDTPYFNPRSDYAVVPSLRLSHVLHQRYEQQVSHYLQLGAGIYHQQDYGTGGVALAGYGIRYTDGENFEAGLSITGISRPYDGAREREVRAMLDIAIRF